MVLYVLVKIYVAEMYINDSSYFSWYDCSWHAWLSSWHHAQPVRSTTQNINRDSRSRLFPLCRTTMTFHTMARMLTGEFPALSGRSESWEAVTTLLNLSFPQQWLKCLSIEVWCRIVWNKFPFSFALKMITGNSLDLFIYFHHNTCRNFIKSFMSCLIMHRNIE